jgi:agmatine deiminase
LTDSAFDAEAQRAYPNRRIIMLLIGAIAVGGGGFHCITQQQPRAVG